MTCFLPGLLAATLQAQSILSSEAHDKLGLAEYEQGDLDEAMAEFSRVIEFSLNSAKVTGNDDHLVVTYDQSIVLIPRLAAACYCRGLAQFKGKNFAAALADFSEAVRIAPQYADAWTNLSATLPASGALRQSIAAADQSIQIRPRNPLAYFNRGLSHYLPDEYAEAIADLSRTLEFDPKAEMAWLNRGNAWPGKHAWNKALADYNQAQKFNPRLASGYNNRGNATSTSSRLKGRSPITNVRCNSIRSLPKRTSLAGWSESGRNTKPKL